MSTANNELIKALELTHPDYKEFAPEWRLYSDVLGDRGIFVKENYLPKGEHEDEQLYNLRIALAQFIPDAPLAIDKLVGALYQQKPKRDLKDTQLVDFTENVDLQGQGLDEFVKHVTENLLGYGTIRLLVNVRVPDVVTQPLTRAEEKTLGVRPFLILYNPLDVIDWQHDKYGELEMVRIVEMDSTLHENKTRAVVKRFIEYDRNEARWWEFVQASEGWDLVDKGSSVHALGMVPMIVKTVKEIKRMVGSSFIRYSARADIQKFQTESDLSYDTHVHSHPTVKVWTSREMSAVGIGSNAFLKLSPSEPREDVGYLEPPSSCFSNLMETIKEKRAAVYRQARTDPLGVLESGASTFQASGASRAWSFATSEARILVDLAGKLEDVENRICDLVLRYSTQETPARGKKLFTGTIQYPDEFDLGSVRDLLEEAVIIKQEINSPILVKELHKRVAAAKVGNTSMEKVTEIFEEIDENELLGAASAGGVSSEMPMAWEEPTQDEDQPDEETVEEDPEADEEEQSKPAMPSEQKRKQMRDSRK